MVASVRLLCVLSCLLTAPLAAQVPHPALQWLFPPDVTTPGRRELFQRVAPMGGQGLRVDGKIDPDEWRSAASVETGAAPHTAHFRAVHDGKRLYLSAVVTQPAELPVRGTPLAYNRGTPWRDDCIEWFVGIETEQGLKHYQFVVTAAGSRMAIGPQDSPSADMVDSIAADAWSAAVSSAAGSWTVEIALTPQALQLDHWPSELLFNASRAGPPPVEPLFWGIRHGAAGYSVLKLQGVPDRQPAHPALRPGAATAGSEPVVIGGTGLALATPATGLQPGHRWLELDLRLTTTQRLDQCLLSAELWGDDPRSALASAEAVPTGALVVLRIDALKLPATGAMLVVSLRENGQVQGTVRQALAGTAVVAERASSPPVNLQMDFPSTLPADLTAPVRFGVPFPPGALWHEDQVRLVDDLGHEVPAQREIAARWGPDGAIRWLLLDAQVSRQRQYRLEREPAAQATTPLRVERRADGNVAIHTGPAEYLLGAGPSPVLSIARNNQVVAKAQGTRGLYVVDQNGRVGVATADGAQVDVEAAGPLTARVRIEADYRDAAGQPMARHITRVELFAGRVEARVTHTLVLTQSTKSVWFTDIGWELAVEPGPNATGWLATDAQNPAKVLRHALGHAGSTLSLVQESHVRFLAGENRWRALASDGGAERVLGQGGECGDWTALSGGAGGLLMACRDTARQHPKEFLLSGQRLTLKLFSPRGGEALDFRSPALVRRWNLAQWVKNNEMIMYPYKGQTVESVVQAAEQLDSDAQGWAKTHELLVAPLDAAADPTASIAALVGPLSQPVLVSVDPHWVCATQALGPLHPRDAEQFPEAEQTLDQVVAAFDRRDEDTGLFGFVDYGSGPMPFPQRGDPRIGDVVRYRYSYNLRRDLLLLAARSTQRSLRLFAQRANRSACDNYFAHWDGPSRVKGGWIMSPGVDDLIAAYPSLPYWWQGPTGFDTAASSEPENLMLLYYLTGDPRAREVTLNYLHALKASWSLANVAGQYFALRYLGQLILAYEFTHDPDFRRMIVATRDLLHDPQALLLVNHWVYSPSYKVSQDLQYLIKSVTTVGDPVLEQWAERRAWYLAETNLGDVVRYQSSKGLIASFLTARTRDRFVAEEMALAIRQLGIHYDPNTQQVVDTRNIALSAARVGAIMTGICYGEDAVTRLDAHRAAVASWVGASVGKAADPVTVYLRKPAREPVTIRAACSTTTGAVRLDLIDPPEGSLATDLNRQQTLVGGYTTRIELEKYSPAGVYRLRAPNELLVFTDGSAPLVLHAPGEWTPTPEQRPWAPIFFRVPPEATQAAITFTGTARLRLPDGAPYAQGKPLTGRVALPPTPGLWSFEPVRPGTVKVEGLPPFFAFRSAEFYFEPKLPTAPN
jgi:hypothetical protein